MVSTSNRCAPLARRAVVWCVLMVVVTPSVGCDRAIGGSVQAAAPTQKAAPGPPKTLAELLVEPGSFPPKYPATVLDPVAVGQAVGDIDGVTAGSVITPPQCAPAPSGPSPTAAVAVRGTDADASSSLTVTLVRASTPLARRRDQLQSCPSFTAATGDQIAEVTSSLLPAPPVDADETFAVDQTVESPDGQTYRWTVLTGQVGDIRVTAAWMGEGDDLDPDTDALDPLFTDAVLKVRRDARP